MNLKEIATRNLLRRKGKAAFVLAGLVVGVATVVAIISFVNAMTSDINHKLEQYGANILVVPKTENLALTYGGLSLGGVSFEMEEIRQAELTRVNHIPNAANVAALGPLVLGVADLKDRRILMAGIDFSVVGILKPWWKIQGRQPVNGELILGSEVARILNQQPGSALEISGRQMPVAGVLEPTGSQDDQLIFSRLETAQSLFGKTGRVSMVEVAALCKDCPIEDMVRQISEALPGAKVMAIQQVVKGRMETLSQFKKFSYGISGVILLIGSLVVLVTMMGSVRERTEEIGIFRAIGFRQRHVMSIIFLEAGIVSILAGVIGYLAGYGAASVALSIFSPGHMVSVPLDGTLAALSIAVALVVGLISSAYPALLAARMDPNDALRAL